MGRKKEIYRDVRFFYGAIQLSHYLSIIPHVVFVRHIVAADSYISDCALSTNCLRVSFSNSDWIWSLWFSYRDKITNCEIRRKTEQVSLSNRIRQRQLKWLGHMLCMKDDRLTKWVYMWKLGSKGSNMKTSQQTDRLYSDCIEGDLRRADVSK